MHLIARNTYDAMRQVYALMLERGVKEDTRNGPVLRIPEPMTITYTHPLEMVNACGIRDANPFFHMMDALWVLAGRTDLEPLAHFLPRYKEYSDDGKTLPNAYGIRLDSSLHWVITSLREDPNSRRTVQTIWRPRDQTNIRTKDKPCNTQLMWSIDQENDAVDLTIINRSNDACWGGVCGANIVQWGVLQKYMADQLVRDVGVQHVFSNNLHVYEDNSKVQDLLMASADGQLNEYEFFYTGEHSYGPWFPAGARSILNRMFSRKMYKETGALNAYIAELRLDHYWLSNTALAVLNSYSAFKAGQRETAYGLAQYIEEEDWRTACINWYERRGL